MRIVSFEEFLKLPRGTVFALYEPEVIGGHSHQGG